MDDRHAGGAGDVGEHAVELEVHLGQGLLHALHVACRILDESPAMAHDRPQLADLLLGAESALEQAATVLILRPSTSATSKPRSHSSS